MAETAVKQEPTLALEDKIVLLCADNPKGINDDFIQKNEPDIEVQQRVAAINRLLTMGKIELLKSSNGLIYRLKCSSSASQVKGIDNQDRLVYQVIESAGSKGIWIRDIRHKCNLMLTEVNKILKNLEGKKLIKAVQSVAASKRKVYMLYNLEPDRSITGGAWYSGQDFESEFVEVLNQQCFKFLQQKEENAESETTLSPSLRHRSSYASLEEVLQFISDLGISKVKLQPEDIETILNTLIYDGKVEVFLAPSKNGIEKLYRSVFHKCLPGGVISPENCVYMTEWMEY